MTTSHLLALALTALPGAASYAAGILPAHSVSPSASFTRPCVAVASLDGSPPPAELLAQATMLAELPAMRSMLAEFALLAIVAASIQSAFVSKASSQLSAAPQLDEAAEGRALAAQALEDLENEAHAPAWTAALSRPVADTVDGMYCVEVARGRGRVEWVCV